MTKQWRVIPAVIATAILTFCGVIIETSMNVTFPALMLEFNTSMDNIQWVTTAAILAVSMVVPISAYLVRNFSIRQLFIAANLLFLIGVSTAYLSFDLASLLVGRVIQGVAIGISIPLMYHIILTHVPLTQRGSVVGIGSMTTSLAPAIGPSFGGYMSNAFGWKAIFLSIISMVLISFIIGLVSIPKEAAVSQRQPFYIKTYVPLAVGLISLLFGIEQLSWLWLLFSAISLILFYRVNRSKTLLNLEVFKERKYNFLVVSVLSVQTMFLGLSFLLPNYLQMALEQNATQAGFFMFPGSLIVALTAPLAGIVFDRRGPFIPIFSGMSIIVLVMVVTSVFFEHLTVTQLLMGNIAVMIGAAFTIGNLVTLTLSQLRPDLQADGNSILNTCQQFTGAAATTVVAKIFSMTLTQTTDVFTAGKLSISFIAFILLMGLISFVSYSRMKAVVEEELVG